MAKIGYSTDSATAGIAQGEDVISRLYDISTLVPAIMLALMAIVLFFGYDLSKKKLATIHEELGKQRANEIQSQAE